MLIDERVDKVEMSEMSEVSEKHSVSVAREVQASGLGKGRAVLMELVFIRWVRRHNEIQARLAHIDECDQKIEKDIWGGSRAG